MSAQVQYQLEQESSTSASSWKSYVDESADTRSSEVKGLGVVADESYNARLRSFGVKGLGAVAIAALGIAAPYHYSAPSYKLSVEGFGRTRAFSEGTNITASLVSWDIGTSTSPPEISNSIRMILASLTGDIIEDHEASLALQNQIKKYGVLAIDALRSWTDVNITRPSYIAEVMRIIGYCDDAATKAARISLVAKGLKSRSPIVRESAALALEDLNDKRAIGPLVEALENEPYKSLMHDYQLIIDSLEG